MQRPDAIVNAKPVLAGCGVVHRKSRRPTAHRRPLLALFLLLFVGVVLAFELGPQLLDMIEKKYGSDAKERLLQWQQLANLGAKATDDRKLQLVNSFFNRVVYVNDMEHWGEEDYWATPIELLATNGGDCEDYSIAKYLTLKAMGVPVDKMRITYVKALRLNQAHMVLSFYETPGAEPMILDNLTNDILPASKRTDLAPVYSFNGDGLWLNKIRGEGKRIGDPDKLSRWSDLNSRLLDSLR